MKFDLESIIWLKFDLIFFIFFGLALSAIAVIEMFKFTKFLIPKIFFLPYGHSLRTLCSPGTSSLFAK
jgi:hypothetical protein